MPRNPQNTLSRRSQRGSERIKASGTQRGPVCIEEMPAHTQLPNFTIPRQFLSNLLPTTLVMPEISPTFECTSSQLETTSYPTTMDVSTNVLVDRRQLDQITALLQVQAAGNESRRLIAKRMDQRMGDHMDKMDDNSKMMSAHMGKMDDNSKMMSAHMGKMGEMKSALIQLKDSFAGSEAETKQHNANLRDAIAKLEVGSTTDADKETASARAKVEIEKVRAAARLEEVKIVAETRMQVELGKKTRYDAHILLQETARARRMNRRGNTGGRGGHRGRGSAGQAAALPRPQNIKPGDMYRMDIICDGWKCRGWKCSFAHAPEWYKRLNIIATTIQLEKYQTALAKTRSSVAQPCPGSSVAQPCPGSSVAQPCPGSSFVRAKHVSLQEQKQMLGQQLFPLVAQKTLQLASKYPLVSQKTTVVGKITGMFLEMEPADVSVLLKNRAALDEQIEEAVKVLEDYEKQVIPYDNN